MFLKLFFKILILFFKNNLFNYFKFFYFNKGCIYIFTNYNYYYNILFFLLKSTFFKFKSLIDIFVSDFIDKDYRFLISYLLVSLELNIKFNIVFSIKELFPLISVKKLFLCSNWIEREIWDFFGIFFLFNKDLRRLILDYGFDGYPLRKDFPIQGFFELFYNQSLSGLFYSKISINLD